MIYKLSITISLVMISLTGICQDKISGKATYIVKDVANNEALSESAAVAHSLEPFASGIASNFTFELVFDQEGSAFFLREDPKLKKYSERSITLSAIKYEYADTVWQDARNSYSVTSMPGRADEPFFIYRVKDSPDWKITNEKKSINGYTCYKATKVIVKKRGNKTFSNPVIAWFCPEFPVGYGPIEYGNLPGLIFELQTERFLYGLSSVSLQEKVDVPQKPVLEKYTEDELIQSLRGNLGR